MSAERSAARKIHAEALRIVTDVLHENCGFKINPDRQDGALYAINSINERLLVMDIDEVLGKSDVDNVGDETDEDDV